MTASRLQTLFQQALQHHQAGRWDRAAALYGEVCRGDPRHPEAHQFGGGAALQLGRTDDAVRLLSRAVQLTPRAPLARLWLGVALAQAGRPAEAESQLREVLKAQPAHHEAWAHLGSVLVLAGRMSEAITAYETALKHQPRSAATWTSLGSALQVVGRGGDALDCHTRALALDPNEPNARSNRAQALLSLHRTDESLAEFDAHLQRFPDDLKAASFRLFVLHYGSDLPRDRLAEEHRAFGRRATAAARSLPSRPKPAGPAAPPDPEKRLRVAFLSPDLRGHSVAYFLEPLLEHLDRTRFDVVLYHDHPVTDATSDRLRSQAARWRNFVGLTHDQVEAQVRADAPDVLVDLAGHTGFNRMPLYARRLAPVQVTYLGYPNTTGLAEMDYRLTDAAADPPGDSDAFATERLVRFSPCAWAYSPPRDAPEPAPPPSAGGAPFTFGSFNTLSKINDFTLRLWAGVLRAVPGSRLLLKTFAIDEPLLRRRAAAAGIADGQLLLVPGTPTVAEHLAVYAQVDAALDPFPYHGTTTTCEALWMGVPVLSLQGDRHSARVGGSLLRATGHPEWAAAGAEALAAAAQKLAAEPAALAGVRQRLRGELRSSPLLDHAGQAGRLGAALRAMWKVHCGEGAALDHLGPAS